MWGGKRENLNKTWLYYIWEKTFCLLLSKLNFEIIPGAKTDPKLDLHQFSSRNNKQIHRMWNNCCFISSLVRNTGGFFLLDNFRLQINTSKLRLENWQESLIAPPCTETCAFMLVVFMQERSNHGWFSVNTNTQPLSLFCQSVTTPTIPIPFPKWEGLFLPPASSPHGHLVGFPLDKILFSFFSTCCLFLCEKSQ